MPRTDEVVEGSGAGAGAAGGCERRIRSAAIAQLRVNAGAGNREIRLGEGCAAMSSTPIYVQLGNVALGVAVV
jgi:hypothetical protein